MMRSYWSWQQVEPGVACALGYVRRAEQALAAEVDVLDEEVAGFALEMTQAAQRVLAETFELEPTVRT